MQAKREAEVPNYTQVRKRQRSNNISTGFKCHLGASTGILDLKPTDRGTSSNCQVQVEKVENFYELGNELGQGNFGAVKSCIDRRTGEILACKIVNKMQVVQYQDGLESTLETDVLKSLKGHKNVVELRTTFEDDNNLYLVMELCRGGELYDQIVQRGAVSEDEAASIVLQLASGLHFCHSRGVVHRDLKPENILLKDRAHADLGQSTVKLADFGLARFIQPGQSLQTMAGSPFYMAPEVLAGRYDQKADVWSLGVILYVLLSGGPPFFGHTNTETFAAVRKGEVDLKSWPWPSVSAGAKDLVMKLLVQDPKQRLGAADVLKHAWISSRCGTTLGKLGEEKISAVKVSSGERQVILPGTPDVVDRPLKIVAESSGEFDWNSWLLHPFVEGEIAGGGLPLEQTLATLSDDAADTDMTSRNFDCWQGIIQDGCWPSADFMGAKEATQTMEPLPAPSRQPSLCPETNLTDLPPDKSILPWPTAEELEAKYWELLFGLDE